MESQRALRGLSGAGHEGLLKPPRCLEVLIFLLFVFRDSSGRFVSRDGAGDGGRAQQLRGRCAQGRVSVVVCEEVRTLLWKELV